MYVLYECTYAYMYHRFLLQKLLQFLLSEEILQFLNTNDRIIHVGYIVHKIHNKFFYTCDLPNVVL